MRVAVIHTLPDADVSGPDPLEKALWELGVEVDWISGIAEASSDTDVVVVSLDATNCSRWERLPTHSELPLVAVIANDGDDEGELFLTRAGFHECIPAEDLQPSHLRRALRRAAARTQSVAVVAQPPAVEIDAFGCPSCETATESHLDLCAECGASFTDGLPQTLDAPAGPDTGGSLVGLTFSGYTLTSLVQVGAFGAVYRATREADRRTVAVKLLNKWVEGPSDALFRFKREGSIQRKLIHPHIVSVLDRLVIANRPAIVMEFVDGFTLRSYIDSGEGALEPLAAVLRFLEMLDGVAYAHRRGIVHRDIKPANILVDSTSEPHAWKLTDFGLAKLKGSPGQTKAGQVLGTARYMSPEQISAPGDTDQRADLYSLACCLFEVLTGASPFPHESDLRAMVAQLHDAAEHLSNANPDIPPAVGDVVARALSKRPEDRYGSCVAFADALREAAKDMGIHA